MHKFKYGDVLRLSEEYMTAYSRKYADMRLMFVADDGFDDNEFVALNVAMPSSASGVGIVESGYQKEGFEVCDD